MPSKMKTCEDYRGPLVDTAAADVEPSLELRSHLDACASCRTAFAEEQQLFAAIDTGVRAVANAEVPASLLPRVRTSLDKQAIGESGWFANRMFLAGAATVVLTASVVLVVWRHGSGAGAEPIHSTTKQAVPPLPPLKNLTPPVVPQAEAIPADHSRTIATASREPSRARTGEENFPEVLVPRDQEAVLISYAAEWGRRKRAPLAAGDSAEANMKLLEVSPIQIAQLDVKLLAEEKSQ